METDRSARYNVVVTTEFWRRWLLCASLLIAAYAAALVVAGAVTSRLFDVLGFGMRSGAIPAGLPREYVLFVYGVLGSVLVGWMVLVAGIAAGPLRSEAPWAWRVVAGSVGTWFLLDTGFSLAVGSWQHALFNLGFVAALGVPLVGWRLARRTQARVTPLHACAAEHAPRSRVRFGVRSGPTTRRSG
jgi:hypothetical protein